MSKFTLPTIVHVAPHYPPYLGGLENFVKKIADKLTDNGHTVHILTSDIGIMKKAIPSSSNHQVSYLRSIEIAHTPIIFSLFYRLLTLSKNSIIHLHIAQAYCPEVVFLASKIRRIPYIAHIHVDVDPSGPMGFMLKPYKKIFLTQVLKNATMIICLSDSQKTIIAEKYKLDKNKIAIIPNGIDESYFIKRTINKKEIPTLLFVGRLAVQKNVPRIIRAMSLLKNKAKLRIVGDGEDKEKIKKLILELKLNNITLVGKKTGKALIEEYKNADIFVLPSNKEGGAPLVLLEALAAGLPSVVSDIYGITELVGDSVQLVPNPSPENFASVLDKVITDHQLQKSLSRKAQERAKQFGWTKTVDLLEKIYKRIEI